MEDKFLIPLPPQILITIICTAYMSPDSIILLYIIGLRRSIPLSGRTTYLETRVPQVMM